MLEIMYDLSNQNMKNRRMLFQNVMYSHQAIDHLQHHISMYKKAIALFHKNRIFNNRKNSRLGFIQKLEETLLHTLASTHLHCVGIDF